MRTHSGDQFERHVKMQLQGVLDDLSHCKCVTEAEVENTGRILQIN